MNLDSPIDSIRGIGPKTKQLFLKLGIETAGDLLSYFPRSYDQYQTPIRIADLTEGEIAAVEGSLLSPISNRYFKGRCVSTASCSDGTGQISLTWYNMPYLKTSLKPGMVFVFRGRIKKKGTRLLIEQPAVFQKEQYQARLSVWQPVYSLTKGLTEKTMQRSVREVLENLPAAAEYLPECERARYHLCGYSEAVTQMHFPQDQEKLIEARRRLVFDEFLFFLLRLRTLKEHRQEVRNHFHICAGGSAARLIASLPYELTSAQRRVWADIERELQGEKSMTRLIQGDVGSGKTILAVLALLEVAENGYQAALMAPTEVLARQHYQTIQALLEENHFPYEVLCLTGSMSASEKRLAYAKMESGEASIIVGTHALIQEKAVYHDLALVITDEQHRFGVRQRETLGMKGNTPHTLVMSATPIPRTLAVILYGDLDISVLNEMPSERLPIKNCVVHTGYRPKAYAFIESEVKKGHQAYVICPMVEESDTADAENVTDYAETLRENLAKDICIESMHGRMKADEKNQIMERFLRNEIQVLVSTTVVEVGVNVPNATVMMIENAQRFGLAQLHQLRGRVGRGAAQSYCIFMQTDKSETNQKRLDILNHSNDGFEIASQDLKLRGPGDIFGIRQSGLMNFQVADIYQDADILQQANEAAERILAEDPSLSMPDHAGLKMQYERLERQSDRSAGGLGL
ncbi:MAG: ATP-dependent DNA helicase RecG [Lachnospiraceae bacterium]|nr:ATP-dependent DNA helicase RecG [Lachnospiraceae bacterium]